MKDWQQFADFARLPFLRQTTEGSLEANQAATQLFGRPPADWQEAIVHLLRCPVGSAQALLDRARAGEVVLAPDPSVPSAAAWHLRLAASHEGTCLIAWPTQLQTSAALQQRAAAADLIAGVSHEVANALGSVIGWTQLAHRQRGDAPLREALDRIETSAQAAHAAARVMLQAVRQETTPAEVLEVASVLADVARLLRAEAQRQNVQVVVDAPTPQWVFAARPQLFTVVWNLAQNAVQAIAEQGIGSTVTLRLRAENAEVMLSVEDDGPGIATELAERIFEPYFTTKMQGTGLGLALVQGAVKDMQGNVALRPGEGGGACFVVRLPRSAPRRSDSEPTPAPLGAASSETKQRLAGMQVLVVEDDNGIREMLRVLLGMHGAEVSAVASAAQALQATGPFDAACIDLTLGDERGDKLLATLRRKGMVRKAVLVSGAAVPADLAEGSLPDAWLRKPFEPRELVRKLQAWREKG